MNPIIEAIEEYLSHQNIWMAPGMPVVFHTKNLYEMRKDGSYTIGFGPDHARMKEEDETYRRINEHFARQQKTDLWDQKMNQSISK